METKSKYEFKELENLQNVIDGSKTPEDLKTSVYAMLDRLNRMAKMGNYSQDYEYISSYINWIVSVPWGIDSIESLDIKKTDEMLNREHYGLKSVKERILEYIATRILLTRRAETDSKYEKALKKSPILCLVGLQGVGKTTMAKSVAKALNREFIRVSMGALGSTLELRGRNKAIPGAEPGQIIKSLIRTKVMNPVILLDELDKVSGETGLRSDMMAVLLEILDPEQNTTFRDHYIDYPMDLSSCLFIVSANNTGTFSAALMDRLEVIRMPSYSDEEKKVIARDYLLPKLIIDSGLEEGSFTVEAPVWDDFIRPLGFDSGIRSLKKNLDSVIRKAVKEIVTGEKEKVVITTQNFKDYLPSY
ncbi:AAA family ATPase [bacterium]|nr:AAA family ATPase [bacterium]